jgi:hypothetical protein
VLARGGGSARGREHKTVVIRTDTRARYPPLGASGVMRVSGRGRTELVDLRRAQSWHRGNTVSQMLEKESCCWEENCRCNQRVNRPELSSPATKSPLGRMAH